MNWRMFWALAHYLCGLGGCSPFTNILTIEVDLHVLVLPDNGMGNSETGSKWVPMDAS